MTGGVLFCSIFGLLSRLSNKRGAALPRLDGLLRTCDQDQSDRLHLAAAKLKNGSDPVVLIGESQKTLGLMAVALAGMAASNGKSGVRSAPRGMIRMPKSGWTDLIRDLLPDAERHILLIEDLDTFRLNCFSTTIELLARFLRAGGAILASIRKQSEYVLDEARLGRPWFQISVADLKNRRADALLIWEQFAREGMTCRVLPEAQTRLLRHNWVGGIEELIEAMESARIISSRGARTLVADSDLQAVLSNPLAAGRCLRLSEFLDETGIFREATAQGIDEVLRMVAAALFAKALAETRGNQRRAADLLQIPGSTFVSRARAMREELRICRQWI